MSLKTGKEYLGSMRPMNLKAKSCGKKKNPYRSTRCFFLLETWWLSPVKRPRVAKPLGVED